MDFKKINWIFFVISFFLPPLGYAFYLVYMKKNERNSYSSGWGALLGAACYIIFVLVWILFLK